MPRDLLSRRIRPRPRPRVNANVVIGALITVIGAVFIAGLSYGIHTLDTRFDDLNASIDTRFDDMNASIDTRFDDMEDDISDLAGRFDDLEASVGSDINGLRRDVNYTNTRLDILIGVLEATQAIPADVVPKSAIPPEPS